jgi:transposase
MSKGVRVIGADRAQLRWEMVDLDSQLPDDHRARLVWAFVQGLDLGEFYDRIKARDEVAGRPATDPQVVLAVWLYATMEGVGSARAIDRLCQQHAAYRWLCGGAPINHDLVATFRRENAAALDPGRVKTCASQQSVEPFSLLPSSDSRRQHVWFSD